MAAPPVLRCLIHDGVGLKSGLFVWGLVLAADPAFPQADPDPAPPPASARYELDNGFFRLSGADGRFDALRVDPRGFGQYSRDLILDFGLGEPGPSPGLAVRQPSGTEIELAGIAMRVPASFGQETGGEAVEVPPGGALAQSFTVASGTVRRVEAKLAAWRTTNSRAVLRLRRGGPDGAVAAEASLDPVVDNAWAAVEAPDLPPGAYVLELSGVSGRAGWWSAPADRYAGGAARVGGAEQPGRDFVFRVHATAVHPARWTVTLARNQLLTRPELLPSPLDARPVVRLTTAWFRDQFALDHPDIAFSRFIASDGLHVPMSQLKRRSVWGPVGPCAWMHLAGRGDFDLRLHFTRRPASVRWTMTADGMTFHPTEPDLALEVLPHTEWYPDYYPRFVTGDAAFDRLLNEFLYDFNFCFPSGANPDWREWLGLALDWTDHPLRTREREILLTTPQTPEGYVHTWGALAGWPFPDPEKFDTRHFGTNALQIIGAYLYFCWTRDADFLDRMRPKLRAAMAWQLRQQEGERGLILSNGRDHHGRDGGIGSNYWDILPFGHLSAYENIYFYESLRGMAELERHWKEPARAAELEALRGRVRRRYNETFWRADKGRYIGCIDADGVEHDYGFVFVNLEAAYHGLADDAQVRRMYQWLEEEPTSSGAADTFTKWVFAPRATTIHNPSRAEGTKGWWFSGWPGTAFGEQCQNGGAILYTSFYDLMVRVRTFGAENAFRRFREILGRYAEPDRLAGGSPRYRGEIAQGPDPGAIGTDHEFPESGLVPAGFLYYFIGASVDIEGLKVRPALPPEMPRAAVEGLSYAGRFFTLAVTPDTVEASWPERGLVRRKSEKVPAGGYVLITPEFQFRAVAEAK